MITGRSNDQSSRSQARTPASRSRSHPANLGDGPGRDRRTEREHLSLSQHADASSSRISGRHSQERRAVAIEILESIKLGAVPSVLCDLAEHVDVEHLVRDELLQPGVLRLEFLEPLRVGGLHAAVLPPAPTGKTVAQHLDHYEGPSSGPACHVSG